MKVSTIAMTGFLLAFATLATGMSLDQPAMVFLTGNATNGNLGGVAGADAQCQAMGEAQYPGTTWRAWLCDATSSPATSPLWRHNTGPYLLPSGKRVADDWADLTDGFIQNPINERVDGSWRGPNRVWSGCSASGVLIQSPVRTCNNWSNPLPSYGWEGSSGHTDSQWTEISSSGECVEKFNYGYYCFQQVSAGPAAVPTLSEWGMIIFMAAAGLAAVCFLLRRRRSTA